MKTQKTRFKIKRSLWDQLKPDTITEEEEEILEGVNEKFEQKNPMIDMIWKRIDERSAEKK